MDWTRPKYSRNAVDRFGHTLAEAELLAGRYDEVLEVVDNWRSSHSYPLHALTMSLRARSAPVDQGALIAQRLKRLPSIAAKLRRLPNMQLSQMQDIGGCRAVVENIHCLHALVSRFERGTHKCWRFKEKYDYVKSPKPDGYRSVHMVYAYATDSPERSCYNKLRIEVQLRSQLQHAWATALETVDTFTRQALKANRGPQDWQRFFRLMGHSIALREGQNGVPGAPFLRQDVVREIAVLASRLNVIPTLHALTETVIATAERRTGHFFLLVLNSTDRTMHIRTFSKRESATAAQEYSRIERENLNKPEVQAVLVSVDSLDALRSAFPNYYLDTTAFAKLVESDIEEAAAWPPIRRIELESH